METGTFGQRLLRHAQTCAELFDPGAGDGPQVAHADIVPTVL
jgi:hypothetical protein